MGNIYSGSKSPLLENECDSILPEIASNNQLKNEDFISEKYFTKPNEYFDLNMLSTKQFVKLLCIGADLTGNTSIKDGKIEIAMILMNASMKFIKLFYNTNFANTVKNKLTEYSRSQRTNEAQKNILQSYYDELLIIIYHNEEEIKMSLLADQLETFDTLKIETEATYRSH